MFWVSIVLAAQTCTGYDATLTANFQSIGSGTKVLYESVVEGVMLMF